MAKNESMSQKSHWNKVKGAVHVAEVLKKTRAEAKSDERLYIRLERALKNFGLNDNAGILLENNPREYHVIVAGPPRSGKSTLIGALCGRGLNATNICLGSRQKEFSCFVKTDQRKGLPHTVKFWNTVGLDPWTKNSIKSYIHDIVQIHSPICLLFCASPITMIQKDHLVWLIESCIEENIFCALVYTNIHTRARHNVIIPTFRDALKDWSVDNCSLIPTTIDSVKPYASSIELYNHSKTNQPMALICQVNSIEHVDDYTSNRKASSGMFELILALMDVLPDDKINEMIYMVLNNRSFWTYVGNTFSDVWNEKFLSNFRRWYETYS